jgi:tartrate-resistant acid phosphatase type 5
LAEMSMCDGAEAQPLKRPRRWQTQRGCAGGGISGVRIYTWVVIVAGVCCGWALSLVLGAAPATKPGVSATKPATKLSTKPTSKPVVAKWLPKPYPRDQVNFLAMGDWGSGGKEQKEVAKGLADYAEKQGVQFNGLLSLGDNFYVQLKDEEDYQFQSLFEDMFDAKRINFPFYAAFGNHDYEKNKNKIEMAYAARHPDSRWKIPSRWYRVDLPAERPLVTVLMLDSNKPQMSPDDWMAQTRWIDEQLSRPRGTRWTIACAHHPLFSNGAHGDNGVLQVHWGPIFKKHRLDFYVCGHDHDLQQLQMPEWTTSFILAGGGGKKPTKMRRDLRGPFSKSLNGFSHLAFFPDRAIVRFVLTDGNVIHQIQRTHDGQVTLLIKGGNDKATNQPLRVLLGLDDDEKKDAGEKRGDPEKDPTDP